LETARCASQCCFTGEFREQSLCTTCMLLVSSSQGLAYILAVMTVVPTSLEVIFVIRNAGCHLNYATLSHSVIYAVAFLSIILLWPSITEWEIYTSLLRAPVSEMTYTVSSGTLNSSIPIPYNSSVVYCFKQKTCFQTFTL